MKNLSPEQKVETMREVRRILDTPDVEIHTTLSREMRETTKDGDVVQTFEATGALGICVSTVSAPALVWPEDAKQQVEDEKERLDVLRRVKELPKRWSSDGPTSALSEETLQQDLKTFIPELFEETGQ